MDRLRLPQLSLRAQLTVALVAVVVFSTALVALVSFAAARRSMKDEALNNVSAAAESRKELLLTALHRRGERATAVVKNIELGCGISGRMNRICAGEALREFLADEDARGARLTYARGRQVLAGDFVAAADVAPNAGAFFVFDAHGEAIYAARGRNQETGTSIDVEYRADDLADVFNTGNTARSAQMALITPDGRDVFFDDPRSSPMKSPAVDDCLAGHDGSRTGVDDLGVQSVMSYRFVPETSGCVLAKIPLSEVFAPSLRLRGRLVALSLAFALIATVMAFVLAKALAHPIARLRQRVRSLELGDFESPVPAGGSTEVQELAHAFQSMAFSLNQSRQALIQSEGRLKMTYHAARLWPWEYEVESGEIRWTDPADSRVLRERLASLLGRIHPQDRPAVQAAIERAQRDGVYDAEYRMNLPTGGQVWVAGRGQVIYDNARRPVLMVGVNLDITARKQSDQALLERERLVANAHLSASLAHEINNPLASIVSALYLLRSHVTDDPRAAQYVSIATEQTDRISRIARQLLGLYGGTPTYSTVSVTDIWARLIKEAAARATERGITIYTDLQGPASVQAFGPELRNAFSNLLLNSMQVLRSGGVIKLRVRPGRSWKDGRAGVRIVLGDNGPGIAVEHREDVFEPFFTTKAERGSGLGLWVTRSVLQAVGGSVRLHSRTGSPSGTVFSIFVPAAPVEEQPLKPPIRIDEAISRKHVV